jgi:hypothetical protein
MNNRVKTSKKQNCCTKGVKIRVEIPDDNFIRSLSYDCSKRVNHKRLVNNLRHSARVYIKNNRTKMRGMYDSMCDMIDMEMYLLVKEKIHSEICRKYPYLTSAVYLQRCDMSRKISNI